MAKSLSIVVEDQAEHDRDIELYIQSELTGENMRGIDDLQREIRERSAGIFLWVVLVVSILNKAYDRGRDVTTMYRKLNEIPPDLRDLSLKSLFRTSRTMTSVLLYYGGSYSRNDL